MVLIPIFLLIVGIFLFFAVTSPPSETKGISRINQIINFVKGNIGDINILSSNTDTDQAVDEQTKEQEPSEA